MDELLDASVREIATAIREKKTTSLAVTRGFLDRIEQVNGQLNAVINLQSDMAIKQAERADIALAGGETPGPLFGVPMTIKDSLDTFDMVTTWGTRGRASFRPGKDATVVGRLRSAGAILMGKTNTPEFTLAFQTDNLIFGKTNNPHAPDRTPGGSSGGAAAILAAGASPFDVGTDTGGSIRLPSHFSGICGIKPTTGRLPCTGNALPVSGLLAPLSQPGPMAKCVDDLIYLLALMRGPDNIDSHCVLAEWHDPHAVDVNKLRIGFHTDNGIRTPDSSIVRVVRETADLIASEMRTPTEVRPSGIEMAGFIFARVFGADNGDLVEALLEDCRTTEVSPQIQASTAPGRQAVSGSEFSQAINLWQNYQSSMLSYFDHFDVLISPVNAHTAITHGTPEELDAYTYTSAYNLTGWPGLVIPAGCDDQGLPIGVQILARPFREDHCLALGLWLESRLPARLKPVISAQ